MSETVFEHGSNCAAWYYEPDQVGSFINEENCDCALREIQRLTAEIAKGDERFREWLQDAKGIRGEICKDCGGSGTKTYSSTATWIGGIGGQAMTSAVCNKCWGSGDSARPWFSHREALQLKQANERLTAEGERLKHSETRLREALEFIEAMADPGTGVQSEESWAAIYFKAHKTLQEHP